MLKKKKSLKLNLIELLLIVVAAYSIAPFVSRFISSYLTTYFYMLLVVLLVVLVLFTRGNYSLNECFNLLFPFLCWKALTFFVKTDSIVLWGYSAMLDILPLMVGYYLMEFTFEDENKAVFFTKLLFVLFVITAFTTLIGCMQYPGAARYLATVEDASEAKVVLYDWRNIGGYSFVYMLVLLHPLLIFAYKRRRIKLWMALLGSLAVILVAIYSEYTTAFLFSLFTCLLYFFKRNFNTKQLIVFALLMIVAGIAFFNLFSKLLLWLAEVVDSRTISERLQVLATGENKINGTEYSRMELYQMSLKTFFQSPLFGSLTSGGRNGGHSFILDFMAQFGLVGIIVLFFMYRTIYKRFFVPYKNVEGYGYVLWLFVQTIILSTVNTGMWLSVLAFFIPVFLKTIYRGETE